MSSCTSFVSFRGKGSRRPQKSSDCIVEKMTTPTDLLCRAFPNEVSIFLTSEACPPD